MTSDSPVTPCLIVGGGPAGLMTALLLARQGIRSLLVERYPTRLGAPKAHAVNPRSLEICRAAGIDWDRFRAKAPPGDEGHNVRFVTRLAGDELGVLTYERQDPAVLDLTPTPLLNIPQPDFEEILLAEIAACPEVELRRGEEWQASTITDDGVISTIAKRDTGDTYQVASRYLVAADGAGSQIRASLGIAMEGPESLGSAVMIHFGADLRPLVGSKPAVLYFALDPDALGTFIAYEIGSTWVLMHMTGPRTPEQLTREWALGEVRHAIGPGASEIDITVRDISPWTMSAQVATALRWVLSFSQVMLPIVFLRRADLASTPAWPMRTILPGRSQRVRRDGDRGRSLIHMRRSAGQWPRTTRRRASSTPSSWEPS